MFLNYFFCIFWSGKRYFLPLFQFKFGNVDKHAEQLEELATWETHKEVH